MDRRPLPGFYFDEERGKYFKIVPDSSASRDSQYTATNVRQAQASAKKRKRADRYGARLRAETLRRPTMITTPTWLATHGRESGDISHDALIVSQARQYVQSLAQENVYDCNFVEYFVKDPLMDNGLLISTYYEDDDSSVTGIGYKPSDAQKRLNAERYHENLLTYTDYSMMRGQVSSMAISPGRVMLVTVLDAPEGGPNIWVGTLGDRGEQPCTDFDFGVGPQHYLQIGSDAQETTLWASAAGPEGSAAQQFVIGSSDGMYLYDASNSKTNLCKTKKDVHAVDWISSHVAVGGAGDRIVLWDTRADADITRFRHQHGVRGLKSMGDQNGLVVSGPKNMAIYDLRMPRDCHAASSKDFSRSLLQLPPADLGHANDFDVLSSMRIMARPTNKAIEFISLIDGKELGKIETGEGIEEQGPRQVHFAQKQTGETEIMAILDHSVLSWTCNGQSKDLEESLLTDDVSMME